MAPCPVDVLPIGDERRTAVGGPSVAALGFAMVFGLVLWLTKEVPSVYGVEPWREDPYDALVSFGFGSLPLLIGVAGVRLRLCRRDEPLPARRLAELFRAGRAAMVLVATIIAAEWISVARSWAGLGPSVTVVALIGWLVLSTIGASTVMWALQRAGRRVPGAAGQPDLLADCVALAQRELGVLGPWAAGAGSVVARLDDGLISRVRRHPLVSSAVLAVVVGVLFAAPKAFIEHYRPALVGFVFGVVTCSFFPFIALVGARLQVVERRHRRVPIVVVSMLSASLGVPLAVTFRNSLWWAVGTTEATAGLGQFVLLSVVGAAFTATCATATCAAGRRLRG